MRLVAIVGAIEEVALIRRSERVRLTVVVHIVWLWRRHLDGGVEVGVLVGDVWALHRAGAVLLKLMLPQVCLYINHKGRTRELVRRHADRASVLAKVTIAHSVVSWIRGSRGRANFAPKIYPRNNEMRS